MENGIKTYPTSMGTICTRRFPPSLLNNAIIIFCSNLGPPYVFLVQHLVLYFLRICMFLGEVILSTKYLIERTLRLKSIITVCECASVISARCRFIPFYFFVIWLINAVEEAEPCRSCIITLTELIF